MAATELQDRPALLSEELQLPGPLSSDLWRRWTIRLQPTPGLLQRRAGYPLEEGFRSSRERPHAGSCSPTRARCPAMDRPRALALRHCSGVPAAGVSPLRPFAG